MADLQDNTTLTAGSSQVVAPNEIAPLQRNIWFKKNCVSCNRHDLPFEQRNWVSCLMCTIDTREFQIKGFDNPRNTKRPAAMKQKLLDNFLELLQIYRWSEIWKDILGIAHYGFVTLQYDGKPEPRNFISMTLTQRGKEVLDRADDPVSDLVVKSLEPSKSPANPPSDPKRKANT